MINTEEGHGYKGRSEPFQGKAFKIVPDEYIDIPEVEFAEELNVK